MDICLAKEIKDLDALINKKITKRYNPSDFLNNTQIQILLYLIKHKNEEICQKDLEIETHLKKASITGTLDSLEDKQMIVRKQSEDDKRKNIILLSEHASKIKNELSDRYKEIEKCMRNNISENELEQFYSTLEKMKQNIK